MLLKHFPAAYRRFVESELERIAFEIQQDQYERAHAERLPRLVPDDLYEASATGMTVAASFTPNDSVRDIVRALGVAKQELRSA